MRRMFEKSSYQQLKADDDLQKATRIYNKVVLFGPSGAGKTRIARALSGAPVVEKTESTIGSNYFEDNRSNSVQLQLWDIGGAERFEALWPMYLRGTQQIILTFDSNDQDSFNELSYFCDKIKKHAPKADVMLVGMHQNPESVVTEKKIKLFMEKQSIQHYYPIDPTHAEHITSLHNALVANAEPTPIAESEGVIQAKELAKASIELLRSLAMNESNENSEIIHSVCKLLDSALLSDDLTHYFNVNTDLIQDQLSQLRFSGSSLYSTACNTIATVLACCAILASGFTALYWVTKVFQENYEKKGSAFLFSTSGAKQLAQEAMHKTSHSTSPGKK